MAKTRDLSDDTVIRTMQLVENSMPDVDRPRMSDPIESELQNVEKQAASLYAAREQSQWKFNQAHKELMSELELLRKLLLKKYGKKTDAGSKKLDAK